MHEHHTVTIGDDRGEYLDTLRQYERSGWGLVAVFPSSPCVLMTFRRDAKISERIETMAKASHAEDIDIKLNSEDLIESVRVDLGSFSRWADGHKSFNVNQGNHRKIINYADVVFVRRTRGQYLIEITEQV